MRTLITGYAGFIGSNLTRTLYSQAKGDDRILGLDAYTYAARPKWVFEALRDKADDTFMASQVDLRDENNVAAIVEHFQPDQVYHLAAESHVCRSIEGPRAFIETNVLGTFNLIEALRKISFQGRLVHVSTDETFGQLQLGDEPFTEKTPINPTSPYSSSKAASDLLVNAYVHTYGLNAVITRCTNNYGPNQHEEKLIPRTILKLLRGESMTLYGDGSNVRDWIHVDDHCNGLIKAMTNGKTGELYCFGSGLELTNRQVVNEVAGILMKDYDWRGPFNLEFTNGRPTDDRRYAVTTKKARDELGWRPIYKDLPDFQTGIHDAIAWYTARMNQ